MRRGKLVVGAIVVPLLCHSLLALPGGRADTPPCPPPLSLDLNQPELIKDLGGDATLRIWQARDPRRAGTFPVSVITLRGGNADLRPSVGKVPGMLNPTRPFASRHVVATMNGDYFRYLSRSSAAPVGLVAEDGRVIFAPRGWSRVVAVDPARGAGHVVARVEGSVRVDGRVWPVHSVNDPWTRGGYNLLTGAWGNVRGSLPQGASVVYFAHGRVTRISREMPPRVDPAGGAFTLPARATQRLSVGDQIDVSVRAVSRGGETILHASGHGGQILRRGKVRELCTEYESLARPRSMIAWDSTGRMLLLTAGTGEVQSASNIRAGGATKSQLAHVARSLGATRGVTMDGGGSTAMFARWGAEPQRVDAGSQTWLRPVPVIWVVRSPRAQFDGSAVQDFTP